MDTVSAGDARHIFTIRVGPKRPENKINYEKIKNYHEIDWFLHGICKTIVPKARFRIRALT